jgi:glycine/D-amino acid oxidase-like deaminating enzyme
MEKNSVWITTTQQPSFSEFPGGKLNVDVAIVGGGISGLTAAILLKRAGRTVAVIEKSQVATGESGYTTAHLTEVLDTEYTQLIKDYGLTGARSAAQSSRAAIDMIDALTHEFEIDCDFAYVSGFKYTDIAKDIPQLESELSAARKV